MEILVYSFITRKSLNKFIYLKIFGFVAFWHGPQNIFYLIIIKFIVSDFEVRSNQI